MEAAEVAREGTQPNAGKNRPVTVHQFPASKARQSLGTSEAVSVREGASLEWDGQPGSDLNRIGTADGRPLAEIHFGDGAWLLVELHDKPLMKVPARCADRLARSTSSGPTTGSSRQWPRRSPEPSNSPHPLASLRGP